jgi:serine/threonine protein kinase
LVDWLIDWLIDCWFASKVVMEYVNGYSLHDFCVTSHPLKEREVSALIYQLLSALAHMHQCGFIHRDVKARNIMINRDGHLKLSMSARPVYTTKPHAVVVVVIVAVGMLDRT